MLLYFLLNACATFVNKLRGEKKENAIKKRAFLNYMSGIKFFKRGKDTVTVITDKRKRQSFQEYFLRKK